MFSRIAYVFTRGESLTLCAIPGGEVLRTLGSGSIVHISVNQPLQHEGLSWVPVQGGWVVSNYLREATVIYQVQRVIDPSVPNSNTVGTTAFKVELPDKTLKLIEICCPPGVKLEDFSYLSDHDLVEKAIEIFNEKWLTYKYHPIS